MKWIGLIILCVVMPLAGCKQEADVPAVPDSADADYFPMAAEDRWIWVGGTGSSMTDTIRWIVAGTVVRDDGKPAWNVRYERSWAGKKPIVDSMNMRVQEDVVLMYMDTFDPDADTVLRFPLTVGREWKVAHVIARKLNRKSVIAGKEDVETPFGSFKSALRVDTEDRTHDTDSLLQRTSDWYFPKIGRVMTRVEARGDVFEMKLLEAELH